MQIRKIIFWITLLATMLAAQAQEEPVVADEPEATEQADGQDSTAAATDPDATSPAEPVIPTQTESGEPGLDSFTPSEEISADRSVAFPNDI